METLLDITQIDPEVIKAMQRFSMIGNSASLIQSVERALKVAPVDLSVLIMGESGSGKEFYPKILHYFGARKHKKYIAVNCGAIPEGTIDSELFGHEKGSFTGAISARKGYFEEADGGTIFLDEVAELPLTTQARLLRVLETGEFMKVGSSVVQKTNIRIVAATNVNLLQAVARGKFREDLYYRLSTIIINVPNLHDRGNDVILLARKFAGDFADKYMIPSITFSEDAKSLMLAYRWPGNVRQLKNVVERLSLFNQGETVRKDNLSAILNEDKDNSADTAPAKTETTLDYAKERTLLWQTIISLQSEIQSLRDLVSAQYVNTAGEKEVDSISPIRSIIRYGSDNIPTPLKPAPTLEESERDTILMALRRNGFNKTLAAKELGISPRSLYRKIRDFELDSPK